MTFSRKNSAVPILFLIALLVFGPLLLLPKPAKASVPTHCTTFLDANCIKEYALDTAAKFVANTILVGLIEELTNWVKTGGVREGSLFVGDFAEHFERELNNAAGLFLEAYLDPRILNTICSPFRIPLGNLFNTSLNRTSFAARAKCTLLDSASTLMVVDPYSRVLAPVLGTVECWECRQEVFAMLTQKVDRQMEFANRGSHVLILLQSEMKLVYVSNTSSILT